MKGETNRMKHIQKHLAILCTLAMLACCLPFAAFAEATPTDLGPAVAAELKVGESWDEGTVRPGEVTLIRLTVTAEAAGPVHVLAEGGSLNAGAYSEFYDPEMQGKPMAEEKTDAETGILHLTWEADAGDYLLAFRNEGAEEAAFSVKVLDGEAYKQLTGDDGDEDEPQDDPDGDDSLEIIITKQLCPGDSWNGILKRNKPAVLKLDLNQAGKVYMLAEGKCIHATVCKTDRPEDATEMVTDPETNRILLSWDAEAGSYLITLEPSEKNLMAKAAVTFMDQEAFDAWEEGNGSEPEDEPADEPKDEPEDEPENEPADEPEDEPEDKPETPRSISVSVSFDNPNPVIGDTAHFAAALEGYDGLNYTVQWQYSPDHEAWTDLPGETKETMDVVVTRENNVVFWRIVVYVEEDPES